jgi:hypothetical protein
MFWFTRKTRRQSPLPVYIDKYGNVYQPNNDKIQLMEDKLEYKKRKELGLTFGKSRTKKEYKKINIK